MNAMHYDVAIPGNHEFDYGADRFLELAEMAEYPYISCNFNCRGELLFDPYVILDAAGKKDRFRGRNHSQNDRRICVWLFSERRRRNHIRLSAG